MGGTQRPHWRLQTYRSRNQRCPLHVGGAIKDIHHKWEEPSVPIGVSKPTDLGIRDVPFMWVELFKDVHHKWEEPSIPIGDSKPTDLGIRVGGAIQRCPPQMGGTQRPHWRLQTYRSRNQRCPLHVGGTIQRCPQQPNSEVSQANSEVSRSIEFIVAGALEEVTVNYGISRSHKNEYYVTHYTDTTYCEFFKYLSF